MDAQNTTSHALVLNNHLGARISKVITFALVVFAFAAPGEVLAGSAAWEMISQRGISTLNEKKARKRIANGLLAELEKLNAYVPTFTPAQAKWLEAERAALESLDGKALTLNVLDFSASSKYRLEKLNAAPGNLTEVLNCGLEDEASFTRELY